MANKKKKKKISKKTVKNIFKLIGIGVASVFALMALSVGIFALCGGFREKVVSLQGMNFDRTAYVLVGASDKDGNVIDNSVTIKPTNEDATKLDVILSADDNNSVEFEKDENGRNVGKVGTPLKIKIIQESDVKGNYNRSGEFVLTAIQEEDLIYASTNIFVESPVKSFVLSASNVDTNKIYPGTTFTVSAKNLFPTNSLAKPTKQIFYDVYGANYFTKQVLYFSSNESVAHVDMLTGEVSVLAVGDFTIFAYMATTYENNAKIMPRESYESDVEYFAELDKLAIKQEIVNLKSKSIEVAGISATTNSFNLIVNRDYSYSTSGTYEGTTTPIDLDISLIPPTSSNYTANQLKYKLEDVQIFEGYKSGSDFFISKNQTYTPNKIESTYLDIEKSSNPLYWKVTPRYYTNDRYLIIRIAKTPITTDITDNIKAENVEGDEYIYYAYVKINVEIIENQTLKLSVDNLLATYDSSNPMAEYDLKANGELLNLYNYISEITPTNATYKKVRFFVENKENCPLVLDGETNLIQLYDADGNIDSNGQYIKATKSGSVKIYASIYSEDRNGIFKDELIKSKSLTLIISSEVNLTDFALKKGEEPATEIKDVEINKGEEVVLSFKVTNSDGFKDAYDLDLFNIKSDIENIVTNMIILPSNDNGNICSVTITGVNVGSTQISIVFNGKVYESFKIDVKSNAVKSLKILENTTVVDELVFTVPELLPKQLFISIDGGSSNSKVSLQTINADNEKVEITLTDTFPQQITVTPKKLCDNISFYVYIVENGVQVKSQVVTIKIKMPDDFEVTAKRNNTIYINTTIYEQVIADTEFVVLAKDNSFLSIKGLSNLYFTLVSDMLVDTETPLYDDTTKKFYNVNENTKCKITLKTKNDVDFWNEEDYLEFYFNIIPKYSIKSISKDVEAGQVYSINELKSLINLYENTYSTSVPTNAYKGKITQSLLSSDIKVFEDEDKLNEITEDYLVSVSSFANSKITLYAVVSYNNGEETITKDGVIILNVSSNLNIVSDAVLNNGEVVTLTNLFKVSKNNVVLTDDATISKVELTQESFVKLFNEGFKFYDSTDNEIINSENANLVAKIKVPQEFNKYSLENLKANITALVNGEETVKENHEFNLSFKLTTLELSNITKIYLDKSSDVTKNLREEVTGLQESAKTNLINSFVITAKESVEEGEIRNVLSSVDVVLDITNNKIIFKLNECVILVDYELVENFATPKTLVNSIVAKSYTINDLLESDYTDIVIYKVTNSSGDDVTNTDAIIENNGTSVYFKNAGTYNIIFKILGREKQIISNLNVSDITVYLNDFNNIYSNVNFDIFEDDDWTKIINNDLKYDIEILKEDGETKLEDGIINISYNSVTKRSILQVLNYMGGAQKVIVRVKLYSSNSVGIVREKQVDLQKLYISTRFTELNGDRQILLNKFTYNLLDYFNVEGAYTNLFYNLSTEGSDVSYLNADRLNNFMVNVIDEDLNITLKLKENGVEKIVKVIGFYVEDLTLNVDSVSEIEDKQTYFVGQILSKQDLLQFVKIKNKINANIEKYNDKIIFKDMSDAEITEFILTSDLATNNKLTVYFGAQSKELSIPANLVVWTNYNGDTLVNPNYDVYPDTKITEYVKAKVGSNELTINFKPVESNISKFENGIYTIKSNDNSYLGTINSKTGEIIIDVPTLATTKSFTIISFVEGASDIDSCKKQIEFNVLPLTKNISNPTMNVYIGDNETEFSDNNYFLQGTNHLTNIDYVVTNINSSVEQDTYSHRINSLTNSDDILKNGKTVASIIVKSGSRKVFKCTSNLDAMEITLRGYLKLTGTGGYKLESLNNNYIEIKVNALKINVNLNYSNIITADNVTYYVLESTNDRDFKIDISAKQDDTVLEFNNIEINTSVIPFVADVTNNAGSLAYNKKIYNINSVARLSFSTFNGTNINLSHDTDYHFTLNKGLVEYIFMQISYNVESYSGTYNICLKPTNTITFAYNSESDNSKDVYAPSNYTIGRNSELLTFSHTNIVDLIASENVKITFSQTETSGYLPSIDGVTLAKVGESYQIQLTNVAKENCYIKVSTYKNGVVENEYIYKLHINQANIKIWTDKSISLENSASSPISITSSQVMDLKDYIYINGEKIVLNYNKDFINSLTFPEIENEKYTLKNNGELTCLSSFVNETLDINFQLLGKTYTIYLKGDEITLSFKYEGTNLTDEQDYTLESGLNYYIASNKGATEYLLDVNLSRTSTISGLDAVVTISNLKYTIGESIYNDQNLFTNNAGIYYFSGQALIKLIRNTNNYSLIVSNELDGNLEFDISIKYRSITIGKHASVTIQNLNINYIEPVIYNNTQYQNVIAGSSFNLSTLISGIKTENLSLLTYKINGLDSTGVSINGSVISAEENSVFEDKYLTVVVGFESTEKYINVKIVPQYKPSTIQNKFIVLKNEVVNYYDYFKLYKFARFDSQMMPVYNMVSYSDNLKKISSKTNVSIGIFSLSFDVLNEDVISEDTYQITVGESVNLINLLKSKFDTTALTNKTLNGRNITFLDNNNFVNADGMFTPTFVEGELENYAISVNINGYETTINFVIKNLEIKVEYKNSINLLNEETNQQKCYENIYATQTLVLKTEGASSTYNYIKLSNNDYYSNLNYAIEIEDYGNLIRKNFTINETSLKYNDVTIFKIENGKMICSANLTDEIKLNIKITLKNNIVVENYFNVRLMPVSLNINKLIVNNELNINNKNLDSANAYNLIYNVFYAQTTCDSNNINLNDVIKVYEVKEEGGSHELITGNKYYFARANKSITIYATINDELQSALVNINYINEEECGSATIFVGSTASENSSILQNGVITAVRSTNATKITYTTNLNGALYYSVYDSNNELLFKIASNGTITNIDTTKSFTVLVEANYLSYTETRNISYTKTGSQITLNNDERYVIENGVKVLTLLSGEKYDCSNLINGNSFVIEDGKYANVSFEETSVKAIITSVTTYGYFTVTNGRTECRVYVKIIPINLGINKTLDYSFSGIVTLEGDPTPIINDGDKFITVYTYNSYNRTIDLNEYLTNFITQLSFTKTYEIEFAVAKTSTEYINVKDNNAYYNLTNNLLTLKNNGDYFIKVIAKIQNLDDAVINLRITNIFTNTINSINVNNNSNINISDFMSINSSDNEFTFNLINSTNSYISNNVLYINEDCSKTIYLYYGINGYFSESVKINVQNVASGIDNYLLGNKVYKQLWYGSNNLDSLYITNIISASLNGTTYDNISVTTKKSDDGNIITYTYTINNLLKIDCMIYINLGICGETKVKFYDKNSNTFIDENKLGIILLEFEYLNGTSKTKGYFKLNDYEITKNDSSVFKYTKQGIAMEDVLKFSLVDENGLVISGTTINDETINSNGITLNVWTGEVSGTKINASKKMYIKAYVPHENYNNGENYKLFEI